MPRRPFGGPKPCSPICRATPTASPSPTAGSSPPTVTSVPLEGLSQNGKTMTLDADEFIRRFLMHVLPDGFHRIRHYGLLANGARGVNLVRCRRLLDARDTGACEPADNHPEGDRPLTAADFAICHDCGGTMRRTATVPRSCNAAPFSCDTS